MPGTIHPVFPRIRSTSALPGDSSSPREESRSDIRATRRFSNWKESDLKDSEIHLHRSRGSHESDFVDAIYDPSWQPACTCETGHRSITISHLANSCAKTGVKSIRWDADKEVSDNAAVNARADIVRYNGWSLLV